VLVPVSSHHPRAGDWRHKAFVPDPLASDTPPHSASTYNAVACARAARAGLDASARRLVYDRRFTAPDVLAVLLR